MSLNLTPKQLSMTAGLIVMASTAPDFIESFYNPDVAHPAKIVRDAAACLGNLLWVRFGFLTDQIAIKVFCSTAAVMLGSLVLQQLWMLLSALTPLTSL